MKPTPQALRKLYASPTQALHKLSYSPKQALFYTEVLT